jgi:hypothetical protein
LSFRLAGPPQFDRGRPIDRGNVDRVHLGRIGGPIPVCPTLCPRQEASTLRRERRLRVLDPRNWDLVQKGLQFSVEAIEESVLPGSRDHLLARLRREQDWARRQVPIVDVILDQLVVTAERTGARVEHHDAACVKVVTRTIGCDEVGSRITGR